MKPPTFNREKTLDKIATEVEKIAENNPNPDTLTAKGLHYRRMKIEGAFRKLNEKI